MSNGVWHSVLWQLMNLINLSGKSPLEKLVAKIDVKFTLIEQSYML